MWQLADKKLSSRLLLGTAQYPSLNILQQAIKACATEVITVSLSRQRINLDAADHFFQLLKDTGCQFLPNTAGCRTAKEAVTMAEMAREIFSTSWIKLEILGDDYSLQPNLFELLVATKELVNKGFEVFPYCTEDLVACQKLVDQGCNILMPWGSPIGSGKGLLNPYALETLRFRFPNTTLIVDAGIGKPSQAAQAMEMGFDGVLLNSAVALSADPIAMASAFKHAVIAGQEAFDAGIMPERNCAHPSTSLIDTPFWLQNPL